MASYCIRCGKELDYGARYCPACGFDTQGQGSSYDGSYGQNSSPQHAGRSQGLGGKLTLILVLGIIWAIISIIGGIACIFGGAYIASALIAFHGPALVLVGVISLVGGAITILGCMYINKLENFQKACNYCLIGSIIAFVTGGIIVGIVGILFYFMLKGERARFRS